MTDAEQNQYSVAIEFLEQELLKAERLAESIRYSAAVLREKGRVEAANSTASAESSPA